MNKYADQEIRVGVYKKRPEINQISLLINTDHECA